MFTFDRIWYRKIINYGHFIARPIRWYNSYCFLAPQKVCLDHNQLKIFTIISKGQALLFLALSCNKNISFTPDSLSPAHLGFSQHLMTPLFCVIHGKVLSSWSCFLVSQMLNVNARQVWIFYTFQGQFAYFCTKFCIKWNLHLWFLCVLYFLGEKYI